MVCKTRNILRVQQIFYHGRHCPDLNGSDSRQVQNETKIRFLKLFYQTNVNFLYNIFTYEMILSLKLDKGGTGV